MRARERREGMEPGLLTCTVISMRTKKKTGARRALLRAGRQNDSPQTRRQANARARLTPALPHRHAWVLARGQELQV